jgi:DNA/RNA endonuclease G (NUC1)
MKKILLISLLLITTSSYSQIKIDNISFTIKHGELTLYLDKDTASYVSVLNVTYKQMLKIDGIRSDKWHKEKPFGPYNKNLYKHTGYDLGHLTPSNITSYNDSLNYHSFSLFNQAPQLAGFNRGVWAQLEKNVEDLIKTNKKDAIIVTGVLYQTKNILYLKDSKIKIPFVYYKILYINQVEVIAWIGSNTNGLITQTDSKTILEIARKNGNNLNIVKIKRISNKLL